MHTKTEARLLAHAILTDHSTKNWITDRCYDVLDELAAKRIDTDTAMSRLKTIGVSATMLRHRSELIDSFGAVYCDLSPILNHPALLSHRTLLARATQISGELACLIERIGYDLYAESDPALEPALAEEIDARIVELGGQRIAV